MTGNDSTTVPLQNYDAFIFDMDGVLTDTAGVHANAWKKMFDDFLKRRAKLTGTPFQPFDIATDYARYVDGKPRYDGVQSFLESRGIAVPYGDPGDGDDQETVCGLGNRKNGFFLGEIEVNGVEAFQTSVKLIEALKKYKIKVAAITSSRNGEQILDAAGILGLFDAKVDGVDSDELDLKGKPDPAIFLEAARRLNVMPSRTVVVEDALSGVEAGRNGGFSLVIGVDRLDQSSELKEHGADIVVKDLGDLHVEYS